MRSWAGSWCRATASAASDPRAAGREGTRQNRAMPLTSAPALSLAADDAEARRLIARIDALSTHHDPVHDGTRVRWRRFGANTTQPPIVLLHGGHGSWMHWLRNAEALSAERTLLLPDMPGFHDSDALPRVAPGEDSLPPLLKALGGTLDMLIGAGTPIDLGGFSFGGLTAARFAVQRGAVRKLALMGSGGHGTLRRMTAQMINWRAARPRPRRRGDRRRGALGAVRARRRGQRTAAALLRLSRFTVSSGPACGWCRPTGRRSRASGRPAAAGSTIPPRRRPGGRSRAWPAWPAPAPARH
jgi:pimeloyl-ACP methyl ester carboxylesterase